MTSDHNRRSTINAVQRKRIVLVIIVTAMAEVAMSCVGAPVETAIEVAGDDHSATVKSFGSSPAREGHKVFGNGLLVYLYPAGEFSESKSLAAAVSEAEDPVSIDLSAVSRGSIVTIYNKDVDGDWIPWLAEETSVGKSGRLVTQGRLILEEKHEPNVSLDQIMSDLERVQKLRTEATDLNRMSELEAREVKLFRGLLFKLALNTELLSVLKSSRWQGIRLSSIHEDIARLTRAASQAVDR